MVPKCWWAYLLVSLRLTSEGRRSRGTASHSAIGLLSNKACIRWLPYQAFSNCVLCEAAGRLGHWHRSLENERALMIALLDIGSVVL